jgi:O-glycosyl hydrolase
VNPPSRGGNRIRPFLFALTAAAVIAAWLRPISVAADNVNVSVDASMEYQRLEGFGQAAPSTLFHLGSKTSSDSLRAIAIEKAYHQVGINMGMIGMILESPGGWDQRRNDNDDPGAINWKGFDATGLKEARRYLVDLAKPYGFTNYYLGAEAPNVRWWAPWLAAIRKQDYNRFLDEAAEQVLATATFWKDAYGEEQPYYQMGNEQVTGNHASMDPSGGYGTVAPTQQVVDLVKRAGARLRAAGFVKTRFVVGTEETEESSFEMASAILADPEARQYVGAIAYHTYPYRTGYSSASFILSTSGAGAPDPSRVGIRNRIRDLARQYKVGAWKNENSNAGDPLSFETFRARAIQIHDEFLYAGAAAYFCMYSMWDQTSQRLHFGQNSDLYKDEGHAVLINNTTKKVDITGIGYAIGHYARWIKPGAVRIEAKSSDPLLQVTAFRDNATGRLTVILLNNANLPVTATVNLDAVKLAGTLAGEQSSLAGYWAALPVLSLDNSTSFHIALPDNSVTSIAAKIAGHELGL